MASANIGASTRPITKITDPSPDQILDEVEGCAYELSSLSSAMEILLNAEPPGVWYGVIRHLQYSMRRITNDLHTRIDALQDMEGDR